MQIKGIKVILKMSDGSERYSGITQPQMQGILALLGMMPNPKGIIYSDKTVAEIDMADSSKLIVPPNSGKVLKL